jgi:hypothetical protein
MENSDTCLSQSYYYYVLTYLLKIKDFPLKEKVKQLSGKVLPKLYFEMTCLVLKLGWNWKKYCHQTLK